MNERFQNKIIESTKATKIYEIEKIQTLWSGYGDIVRYGLEGCEEGTIIVKHIKLPKKNQHPRGWNSDLSHKRKLRSYQVEIAWYREWSKKCNDNCRVPKCYTYESHGNEILIVLEDLDYNGFPKRKTHVSLEEIKSCISWLANFHAVFMGEKPANLWKTGTYWHLDTRPDELKVLDDPALKKNAHIIDQKLKDTSFQTFVHGDAKLANFCFSYNGKKIAAVDFQYVGGGCGMKDLAYFIGSCLREERCEEYEDELLNYYFNSLQKALSELKKNIDFYSLENEWRALYPIAWTDFHRFLKGWSPGHWKLNSYSEKLAKKVIEEL